MGDRLDFIQELPQELQEDPGDISFLGVAGDYREKGELLKAVVICLRGLSANPSYHQGRLLLARLYFELECLPFALKELELLHQDMPHIDSIGRLLERLSPGASNVADEPSSDSTYEQEAPKDTPERSRPAQQEETLAETDFDFDELDDLEDLEDD